MERGGPLQWFLKITQEKVKCYWQKQDIWDALITNKKHLDDPYLIIEMQYILAELKINYEK